MTEAVTVNKGQREEVIVSFEDTGENGLLADFRYSFGFQDGQHGTHYLYFTSKQTAEFVASAILLWLDKERPSTPKLNGGPPK